MSSFVIDCLNRTGIGGETKRESLYKTTFTRMRDMFHQDSCAEIKKAESKLRTYGKLKTKIGMGK